MPSKEFEVLTQKIKDWNTNLQFLKKLIDREDQKQKTKLEKTMDNINELSYQIKKLFQVSANWPHADKVKAKKFQKDFVNKMEIYTELLGGYRKRKTTQLSSLKNSYSERRSSMLPNTNSNTKNNRFVKQKNQQKQLQQSSQQSHKNAQIQLEDVNQQTLFHEHMIQLKQKQLLQVKNKMQQALKVQKQVGKLVNQQQKDIDEIEDNVESARENVKEAGTLIQQGADNHKAANRKKLCIMGICFIILLIIVIPIMIKFL